jgi:hypothetical protein
MSNDPMYGIWNNVKEKCYNEKSKYFPDCGGKGITMCEEWKDFEKFYTDMKDSWKKGLQLGRKDKDKGYYKENCQWITHTQKNRHKKTSKMIEYKGETKCLSEWCEILKVDYDKVYQRLSKYEWTAERALETP